MSEDKNAMQYDWGIEAPFTTASDYSGKILIFEKAHNKTSMHFHKEKHKTYFVNAGKFNIRYIDVKTAAVYDVEVEEGNTYEVVPLQPVQIIALADNSSLMEISNSTDNDDIYHVGF